MQKLICRQCMASLDWDGQSEIVRCGYCGMRYRMHPRGNGAAGVRTGVGAVSPIQTTNGRYAGAALVKSYIPEGWSVSTNAPEAESNLLCPLTMQVSFESPRQDACILFTGTRAYNHLEPTPQNAQMQGRMVRPDYMIGLAYRDAATICDGVLGGNPALSDVRVLSESNTPDALPEKLLRKTVADYQQAGMLNPGGSWSKKYATVRDQSGELWHKQVEALVSCAYLPVSQQEQMLYQMLLQSKARTFGMGGLLGGLMGMASGMPPAPQPKLRWISHYIIETSAKESAFTEAMRIHDKIRESIELLPLFHQETARIRDALTAQGMQESNAINDALSQMNRDRMASWDRQRSIIQSTSDYGTQVMREMRESTARTHQNVANLQSEAIRGVNTFYTKESGYGVPPVVEASTQWDHVYQNTQYPDRFAASTGGAPLEFGVDYEELDQTNGNY